MISTMRAAPWGGSEELWFAAARCALARGHEVAVSGFDWPEPAPKVLALRDAGAVLLRRPARPSQFLARFRTPRWIRELERFAPEVVCLSQGAAYECVRQRSTRPLLEWLDGRTIPLVLVVQYNDEEVDLRPRTVEAARRLFVRADTNVFVARRNLAAAERHLGISIPNPVFVCNPVNLRDTSAIPWPSGEEVRLACVARLHADTKGHDLLFEALATAAWRDRRWRLSIFGDGPDRERYRKSVDRLGLDPRVEFLGHVEDVRSIWNEHHLLVLPSRSEGTPLAMLEAMLLGRACLAVDVGGCPDWIADGENGFLAGAASVAAVAETLERAWSVLPRWRAMGEAARETMVRRYDLDPGATLLALLVPLPTLATTP